LDQRFKDQLDEIEAKKEVLQVFYIKLGEGGKMFEECLKNNLLYIGFGTETPEILSLSNLARDAEKTPEVIEKINRYWKNQKKDKGTASRFTNSLLTVSQDTGNILWITIENKKIYYGLSDGGNLEVRKNWIHNDFNNGSAKKMLYGWCDLDVNGELLDINKISGSLTKTSATRGTVSRIKAEQSNYLINKLFGRSFKFKTEAKEARLTLIEKLAIIIKDLQPSEFEVLVDLIFSSSGWKRDGELGGNIKFVDVTLQLPSTNERAGVQVKTESNKTVSQKYIVGDYKNQGFDKFFYVYHTGSAIKPKGDDNYFVWGVKEVSARAVDAGLCQWIIDRAYR
jgi:hypothetical protein